MTLSNNPPENPHNGHRQRMIERYIKTQFSSFGKHEVFEFMLFYAIPRKDTNVIGHALMAEFGCVQNIMSASIDELMHVKGIGIRAAVFINALGRFSEWYDDLRLEHADLGTTYLSCQYFLNKLNREAEEVFLVACLDDDRQLVCCLEIARGTSGNVDINPQNMIRRILNARCNIVILSHNHPMGRPYPSTEDIDSTKYIAELLQKVSVKVLDHIIVAKGTARSMKESGYFHPR